jgi:quercetin dioxygenase-like cupin family protein
LKTLSLPILAFASALASCTTPASDQTTEQSDLPTAFVAGWKGEKVCEPLFENEGMRAARCTFPPGIGHERHFHRPHFGYIVSGATMRMTDASGTHDRVLQTGATWWSDGIAWHEGVNISDTTGIYIIVEPK